MGAVRPPKRAKLFVGILSGDTDLFDHARRHLLAHFGPEDFQSPVWPFTFTDYYEAELGPDIHRTFVFYDELVSIERIAEIKRQTNAIEARMAEENGRPSAMRNVNLDPGYITLGKLVLATTKDQSHRIYVQSGIFAEVTLRYQDGQWHPWPWTYPDYASSTYHDAFTRARERLKDQLSEI